MVLIAVLVFMRTMLKLRPNIQNWLVLVKKKYIPKTTKYTEDEVVDIIKKVSRSLAQKFVFGYHDRKDLEQQASLIAWQGFLENYDGVRPLENFLRVHVKNRLCNYKRKHYERLSTPCSGCPHYDENSISGCLEYVEVDECLKYSGWIRRNSTKKNLMAPIELANVQDERENTMKSLLFAEDIIVGQEVELLINKMLPISLRHDYLRLKNGMSVHKIKREEIREIITLIINGDPVSEEVE